MDRVEKKQQLLESVMKEFHALVKNLPEEALTHEFVCSYLFNRIPQQFSSHQLNLYSLSIISVGDHMFEVSVNFTIIKRIFFR
ncbi:hypothetical protein [Algoriphagus sp.]|uniref:hypothetical protein n=1 Tax=Algoriphagus sp. TaxID=1872435 RepID=UPI003F6FC2AE